jgi:outer membrane protein assembly factor BamB
MWMENIANGPRGVGRQIRRWVLFGNLVAFGSLLALCLLAETDWALARVQETEVVGVETNARQLLNNNDQPTDDNSEDWRQFRGSHGLGTDASETRYPAQLDGEKSLLWKVPVATGHSSPIVVGDLIVVTGHESERLITQCFDRTDGQLKWQQELPIAALEKTYHHGPATPTAVSDGERIYCLFGSFGVIAYDLTGQEVWRKELEVADNMYGTAASPILVENRLIVLLSDQKQACLMALEKTTGQVIWTRKGEGPASSWSTPALWPTDSPQIALIYEPFHVRAISLQSGDELWSIPGLADEPIAIPQIAGNLAIVTSYNMRTNPEVIGPPSFAEALAECDKNQDGQINPDEAKHNKSVLSRPDADGEGVHPLGMFFRMLDKNRNGQIEESEWPHLQAWIDSFQHANGFVALRIEEPKSAPTMAWRAELGVPECPTSLILGDQLFAVRNGGVVTLLSLNDGQTLFRERIAPTGPYYASPVRADHKIYLASARGELAVFRDEAPFDLLSKLKLEEQVWATPALSRGNVIVRSERHLWLFR